LKSVVLTAFLCLAFSVSSFAQNDFTEGLRWYNQRSSGAVGIKAKPEHINKAIAHFEKALINGHREAEVVIYLMKCYNFKGRFVMENQGDKRRTYQLAKELGDKYVPKYPLNKEMRFQYLAAIGQWGDSMGVFRAAKEGVVDMVKTEMEALIKLDPEFRNGIGERALAVLNLRVPKIPFILSWPDKKKALSMTNDVINRYPNDIGNNYYHAEALVENGKDEEAKNYLMKALSMSPDPDNLLEEKHYHVEAKKMLQRLGSK
jgi:tetratricopeptide (TPR) repeat protein